MARTLGGRAGGRATATATATTTTDELSQPIQAPSPRRAGIKYPVRVTPHSDENSIKRQFRIVVPLRSTTWLSGSEIESPMYMQL